MQQTEASELTSEDKQHLESEIKELEKKLIACQQEGLSDWVFINKELRRLRRMRV